MKCVSSALSHLGDQVKTRQRNRNAQALEWLVSFARMSPMKVPSQQFRSTTPDWASQVADFSEADWMRLRVGLSDFMHGSSGDTVRFRGGDEPLLAVTKEALEQLHHWAKDVVIWAQMIQTDPDDIGNEDLRRFVTTIGDERMYTLGDVDWMVPIRWAFVVSPRGKHLLARCGDLGQAFLLRGMYLLLAEGGDRVRMCPRCWDPFWREGKKRFCSKACTNKAAIARMTPKRKRERDKGRRKSVKAARQYYKTRPAAAERARRTRAGGQR
jgi:hypothetical protein